MTLPDECRIDPAVIAALYVQHAEELRAFLLGVLREPHLVADVLQTTFVKAIEQGHTAQQETLKGWIFQVAFREALAVRRRQSIDDRARQRIVEGVVSSNVVRKQTVDQPPDLALQRESIERVRAAVESLSPPQREVVRLRVYEQLKFTDIAAQTGTPLGTVLARMQAALKRLRDRLEP